MSHERGRTSHLSSDIHCRVAQQMRCVYFCMHAFVPNCPPFKSWTVCSFTAAFRSTQRIPGVTRLSVISCPALSVPCETYRSTGSPSRPWRHSVAPRPATTAASWCRSPAGGPASSPSPAWSHCHSQSSSPTSPPANGPRHTELRSGHDACGQGKGGGGGGGRGDESIRCCSRRMISCLKATMSNYESYQLHADGWQIKASCPFSVATLASSKPSRLAANSARLAMGFLFFFFLKHRWSGFLIRSWSFWKEGKCERQF